MHSSADILGAAGKASKDHPLSLSLLRLFNGDNGAVSEIIELMTSAAVGKAYRVGPEISRVAASFIARLVLDWYRDSTCKACGGHGFKRMNGAPTLSDQPCGQCAGTGRRNFDAMFPKSRLELARWLAAELEREQALAGPAAMAALAPRLDL
jgi:hypothetical protein